jgi:hypothetical protein
LLKSYPRATPCKAGHSSIIGLHVYILWRVNSMLGNDRETSNYTTAVTRQWPVNSNRGTVFSVRSLPRCYEQRQLVVAVSELEDCCGSVVVSCCC